MENRSESSAWFLFLVGKRNRVILLSSYFIIPLLIKTMTNRMVSGAGPSSCAEEAPELIAGKRAESAARASAIPTKQKSAARVKKQTRDYGTQTTRFICMSC